ncbi:MAG: cell division protein FtsZ, partial [Frankiales bacterium]|nr:cell division protein FtsZ [Frankiales bacterium]
SSGPSYSGPSPSNPGATWTPSPSAARKPVNLDEDELDVPDFLK